MKFKIFFAYFNVMFMQKIKIINQVFRRLSINQFIRFFYKVNIDWKNLNER